MLIRHKVLLIAGISILLSGMLLLTVLYTFSRIQDVQQEHEFAHKLNAAVSRLDTITYEYLMYREQRMLDQWQIVYAQARDEMEAYRGKSEQDELQQFAGLASKLNRLQEIFSNLTAYGQSGEGPTLAGLQDQDPKAQDLLQARLVSQLLMVSDDIKRISTSMAENAYARVQGLQEHSYWIIAGAAVLLALVITSLCLFIVRSISQPMTQLLDGIRTIGQGDLTHTISVTSKDEIGDLASAFNRMTSNLSTVTASRDELNTEIEERKRAEAQLETERKRLLALLDGIDDVIYVSDPESYELLHVNDAFKRIWGPDAVGRLCYQVLQERNSPCPFCTNSIIFGDEFGARHIWEFQNQTTGRWYRCADKAIQWTDGRWVRFELAADISKQKQAQAALAREKAFSDYIIDSLPGVFYLFDEQGVMHRWNRNLEEVLGYTHNEIATMKALDMFTGQDRDHIYQAIQQVFVKGRGEAEASYLTKDGRHIPHAYTGVRVEMDGKPMLIGVGIDITERKQMERRLEAANLELQRSNQELEQFAYVASHDLQEPLRMVSSYTQLLEKRYKDQLDDSARTFIRYAVDGATRMQGLINDLLAYSRIATKGSEFTSLSSQRAFENALANLGGVLEETNAEVTYEELPDIVGDFGQLTRVFQNLLSNSLKYRNKEVIPRIHVSVQDVDSEWRFSVQDNSIGIDPQYKDRIFKIFQRLHTAREYSGTGMGLSMCKRIIERHGGRIWVESEPGAGSTFYFTMPQQSA
jgi:PAS domain S-box-containing protein